VRAFDQALRRWAAPGLTQEYDGIAAAVRV